MSPPASRRLRSGELTGFALNAGAAMRFERAGVGFPSVGFGLADVRGAFRTVLRSDVRVDCPARDDSRALAGRDARASTGSVSSSAEPTAALVELDPDNDAARRGSDREGWAGSCRGGVVGRKGTVSGCSEPPRGAGIGSGPIADA
jgi:hypothetical protein